MGLANSNDPILLADGLGGVVFANKLFEQKFGKHKKLTQGLSKNLGLEEEVFEGVLREAVATGKRQELPLDDGMILIDPIAPTGELGERGFIIFWR